MLLNAPCLHISYFHNMNLSIKFVEAIPFIVLENFRRISTLLQTDEAMIVRFFVRKRFRKYNTVQMLKAFSAEFLRPTKVEKSCTVKILIFNQDYHRLYLISEYSQR